jgi:hypothetical protein
LRLLNITSHALVLAVIAMAAVARAADAPDPGSQYSAFAISVESPRPLPAFFWQRFDDGFTDNANEVFADALQPLKVIQWDLDLPGKNFPDNLRQRVASRASFAFMKSVQYGTREAVVDLPLMAWLDEHDGWFADLLRGSIDDVGEEEVSPLRLSYERAEQSWWKRLADSGTHYGLRPFRTSPYAYVSHGFTDGGDNTVLLANLRYYYDHFAHHRVELALSVPMAYGMTLDFGSAYEFGAHEDQKLVVKLLKEIKGGGIAHVGFEVRDHPTLIAGITFPW